MDPLGSRSNPNDGCFAIRLWHGSTQVKCQEAEELLQTYGASAEAYGLAADALATVLYGSRAEFWSALKIAESAKDDCNEALKAIDLHIVKHQCELN
jgi:hypothetical protein